MATTMTIRTTLMGIAAAGLLGLAVGVSTCGGVTDSRTSARDRATTATCNRYNECHLIGTATGAAYATYDSCATIWRGKWEEMWPPLLCGAIDQEHLTVCLGAITATDCTNVLDFLATLGKCQAQDICVAAAVDAGGGS